LQVEEEQFVEEHEPQQALEEGLVAAKPRGGVKKVCVRGGLSMVGASSGGSIKSGNKRHPSKLKRNKRRYNHYN
jgi:hypothetical protein